MKHALSISLLSTVCLLGGEVIAADNVYGPWSTPENISQLNTSNRDGCQFITRDGLTMYMATDMVRSDGSKDMDLHISKRDTVDSEWGAPQHLGYTLNQVGTDDICPNVTPDGYTLYIASEREDGCGGRDIYISHRDDNTDDFAWTTPVNVGCEADGGVNSSKVDQGPTYFEDKHGNGFIIFSSNRPANIPGFGGHDLYIAAIGDDGIPDGSTAAIAEELSSSADDNRPYMREDGLEVYFDSKRGGPSFGDDVYVATRKTITQKFSAPVAVTEVNSAKDERRAVLGNDGTELYMTTNRVGGKGSIDVWRSTREKLE